MSHQISCFLADELATGDFGRRLAVCLPPGTVVYLEGDLGAGKTTLVRALLRALGHQGPVKSPTYTLVEVYVVSSLYWYHFDFYRFNHPEEFVDAGLGEYFRSDSVCLVEWPDKAAGFVPAADLVVKLEFAEGEGRRVALSADSPVGEQCLNSFLNSPMSPGASSSALPVGPLSSSS
jgi:tRNA threonylcarbamoyladenosine biosynthesis protein TsaE